MPHRGRIVGIDVSKRQAEACLRSPPARLAQPSTPEGRDRMIAWLREREVGLVVMEASGGYEREWAEALRRARVAVRIVDPTLHFTLKMEAPQFKTEFRNIKVGPQPDSLFEVPADYQKLGTADGRGARGGQGRR